MGRRPAALDLALSRLIDVLLALDTATQAVTVALADDSRSGRRVDLVDALRHGELLAPGDR